MKKSIYLFLALIVIIVSIVAYFQLNKSPETAEEKKSDYKVSVIDFEKEFIQDVVAGNTKYLNKTVEITGIVSEININGENTDVVLQCEDPLSTINVQLAPLSNADLSLTVGKEATLKALYVGVLSDLGMNIEFNNGVVIKTE